MSGVLTPTYRSGFYAPPRGGRRPKYPQLWRGCIGAWSPSLGSTGSVLRDWSGFSNHGALTSMDAATDWIVSGGAYDLDLDGSNDYIDVPGGATRLSGLVTASQATWVYRVLNSQSCMQCGTLTNGFLWSWFTDNKIYSQVNTAATNAFPNVTSTLTGWTHIVQQYCGSRSAGIDRHEIYINGVFQTLVAGGTTFATVLASMTSMRIGRDGNDRFQNGAFDDHRLYNRLLTPPEIRLLASRRGIAYERTHRRIYKAGADFPGSGSASFNFTAAAGGAADRTGSGAASFNFTAAAGGASNKTGSGAATFNFTAAAGGTADRTGSGSSTFNFTASAGGASESVGSGSGSFSFTAAGDPILEGTGTGSASFNFTASAGATTDATGTGSGTFQFNSSAGSIVDGSGTGLASFSFIATAVGLAESVTSGSATFRFDADAVPDIPIDFGTPKKGWRFEDQELVWKFRKRKGRTV